MAQQVRREQPERLALPDLAEQRAPPVQRDLMVPRGQPEEREASEQLALQGLVQPVQPGQVDPLAQPVRADRLVRMARRDPQGQLAPRARQVPREPEAASAQLAQQAQPVQLARVLPVRPDPLERQAEPVQRAQPALAQQAPLVVRAQPEQLVHFPRWLLSRYPPRRRNWQTSIKLSSSLLPRILSRFRCRILQAPGARWCSTYTTQRLRRKV
jgi:hypothetical protein